MQSHWECDGFNKGGLEGHRHPVWSSGKQSGQDEVDSETVAGGLKLILQRGGAIEDF